MEYQSKHLLKKHGVAVQDFCMVDENGNGELDKFSELNLYYRPANKI